MGWAGSLDNFSQLETGMPPLKKFASKEGELTNAKTEPFLVSITTTDPALPSRASQAVFCKEESIFRTALYPDKGDIMPSTLIFLPTALTSICSAPFFPFKYGSKYFSTPYFPTVSPKL